MLVVDDDPDALDAVVQLLAAHGWSVAAASSGRAAIDTAREWLPDVVVVDLIMPEVTGADVCAAVRAAPQLHGTRLLVLSGAEDARLVAAECNADGALGKPVSSATLIREVERLLGS